LYTPDLAAAMRMPVLLLQGDEDRVNAALENADLLLPVLPDARMEILTGLGHLPEIEAPMQVNTLLRRFYAV
jgi:pimeloyl-ACP methyl ester carboxylesterase